MKIGIPKETKDHEFRVALIPPDVKKLVDFGHEVVVEYNAGRGAGFSNRQYRKAGAIIKKDIYDCEMVVRVKEPPLHTIKENQIIMAYLHIEKNQNPDLLNELLKKNVTSYGYEEIKDSNGERLVNLGYEAGLVGMYEGLRVYGALNSHPQLRLLPSIWKCTGRKKGSRFLRKLKPTNTNVAIMGNGRVSAGVQEALNHTSITPLILERAGTPQIENYLPNIDILVNAIVWYPNNPHLLTRDMLKLMKPSALIIDISCDRDGAIQTCIPARWERPLYQIDGITHFCVENLPSAIPTQSSIHLSTMILPHVLSVANRDSKFKAGLMTKEGLFRYKKPEDEVPVKFKEPKLQETFVYY